MPKTQTFDRDGNLVSESEEYPDTTQTPAGSRQWWPREFVGRLMTQSEVYAVETSLIPTVVIVRSQLLTAVSQIELDSPETIAAVSVLVSAGVLTQSRADAILAGEPVA